MRKNKGFTLIELLAVIVILAIIAVITVPKVAEMIETSRQGAAEDAFYGAIKSAELGWAKALQKNPALSGDTTCTVGADKTFSCDNGVTMTISGSAPESGSLVIDGNGAAAVAADSTTPLVYNGFQCTGTSSKATCTKVTK